MTAAPSAALSPMAAHHVAAGDRLTRFGDLLVSADVIGMNVRVDDIANRPFGHLPDGCQDLVGILLQTSIDKQHAVFAGLHGDVAARAHQHGDVALHRQHVDLCVAGIL